MSMNAGKWTNSRILCGVMQSKKLQMQGLRKLKNEAYIKVRRSDV